MRRVHLMTVNTDLVLSRLPHLLHHLFEMVSSFVVSSDLGALWSGRAAEPACLLVETHQFRQSFLNGLRVGQSAFQEKMSTILNFRITTNVCCIYVYLSRTLSSDHRYTSPTELYNTHMYHQFSTNICC